MANRTIQIYGQGYGPVDCTASVIFNGTQVFNGTIPTINSSDIGRLPTDQTVILSFDVSMDIAGKFPVEMTLTGNDIYVEQIFSNYNKVPNTIYNQSQWAILTNPSSTMEQRLAVYEQVANPPLTTDQINIILTGTDAEVVALLTSLGLEAWVSSGANGFGSIAPAQSKSNVVVNGDIVPLPDPLPSQADGEWGYEVEPAPDSIGTITFDLNIVAGKQ